MSETKMELLTISPSNIHTTQQETKTTVMKLSQKRNRHLRPLQVNKEQAWAIWEEAAGNLMCLSKQVADTRNRTSKSCIGYWRTKDENWRKRSTKQRKRQQSIIFECGRKWGWYERSPEICWKPRKYNVPSFHKNEHKSLPKQLYSWRRLSKGLPAYVEDQIGQTKWQQNSNKSKQRLAALKYSVILPFLEKNHLEQILESPWQQLNNLQRTWPTSY